MKTAVILLAAGSGKRMQAGRNKLFLTLHNKPVLAYTAGAFQKSPLVDGILVVAKDGELEQIQQMLPQNVYDKIIGYTIGGKERQDSVLCGLKALPAEYDRVMIHDGARPFVTEELIAALMGQLTPECGTIAAVPAKDTVKRVDESGFVQQTLKRSELWNIQTPQCFYTAAILECYLRGEQEGFVATDDASLAEQYGLAVKTVPAYYENIKLTTPEDLDVAEVFLKRLNLV
ncbi:MAG: 2-C-methyl-D-erythritol 4-phosphate cytidylyltransferase [Peptococcaceae bacterium]|nr:2-C-methyl-D-erythritol 4-phosphate cytidylyltransferase [Peptococcaceae bacterium]